MTNTADTGCLWSDYMECPESSSINVSQTRQPPLRSLSSGMADDFVNYLQEAQTNNPEELARIRQQTADGDWGLLPAEVWWRDHQRPLNSHGYELRPRFRPDWTPSWVGTNILPDYCEDSLKHLVRFGTRYARVLLTQLFASISLGMGLTLGGCLIIRLFS